MSNSSSTARTGHAAGRAPVQVESLESRTMLSVTASVTADFAQGGLALLVTGDSANNTIAVSKNADGTYKVTSGSSTVISNADAGIGRIVVFGNDGADSVIVGPNITVPAYLYGGNGNDSLRGGGGADVIVGGDGDDLIVGNTGRNLLVGGTGGDRIAGDNDDDIFVSGTSDYDTEGDQSTNQINFVDIMREWNRNGGQALPGLTDQDDYAERVFHILIAGTGNNTFAYLSTEDPWNGIVATVHDDGVTDILTGNQGQGTAVYSIEQVKVAGNGEIDGNVTVGLGYNVKFSGANAEVTGDIINEAVILPDVVAPSDAINLGNYSKSTGTHTLAAGTYVASNFSLSGTATFNTTGPVTIYVTGTLSLTGQSVGNDNADDLQFYVTSSNTVQLAGQGVLSAQIYASKSEVQVSGNGIIEGQVKAKRVTVTGNGLITYDTGLASDFDLFFFSATNDVITDLSGEEFAQDLSFIFEL